MAIWSLDKNTPFNKRLHQLCFQANFDFDQILIPYDLKSLIAHSSMLFEAGYLNKSEKSLLEKELNKLLSDYQEEKFAMTKDYEDCHSLIEEVLIKNSGELGKKLYMARSRNDQIIQALRLYSLDKLRAIEGFCLSFAKELLKLSKRYEFIPMPGYTHTQRAMPSSLALWISSYLESLLQERGLLREAYKKNSLAVLGTAAGYGTCFKIDRKVIQKELGLKKMQVNSLACQLGRGQIECQTLQSLWGVSFILNRFAHDLVWLNSQEFSFVKVDESCTTGSSIMPQKKNLDPCEIVRAKHHLFCGYINQINGVISNLFLGYHSDYQENKEAFIKGLNTVELCLEIMVIVAQNIGINKEAIEKAFSSDLFATDLVNRKVKEGMSFRNAYREVKKNLHKVSSVDPVKNLKEKTMLGSTGNLGLELFEKELDDWEKSFNNA